MSIPSGLTTVTDRCELLDWDSDFFGVRIARLVVDRLDDADADAVVAWCEERGVDCLYLLAGGDDRRTLRALETRSFELVDVRIDLARDLEGVAAEPSDVRVAREPDLEALAPIARDAFTASRFFFDGRLPRDRCTELFEIWLARSVAGELAEAVLVADRDGAPAGFVTCELDDRGRGRIGLLGVAENARGRGVGRQLCLAALERFAARGASEATVTTQGRSDGALRLYERCGFTTGSVRLWYHRWFDRPDP